MYRRIIFFILFTLFVKTSAVAGSYIDSLNFLVSNATDTSRIRNLNLISFSYYELSEYDSTIVNANRAIELQKKHSYPREHAYSYYILGKTMNWKLNNQKSFDYSMKGYEIIKNTTDYKLKALLLTNIAWAYFNFGDSEKALECFLKGLALAEKHNDRALVAEVSAMLGRFYMSNKNLDLALQTLRTGVELYNDLLKTDSLPSIIYELGRTYATLGTLMSNYYDSRIKPISYVDSALLYYNRSISTIRKFKGEKRLLTILLLNSADAHNIKEDYVAAIDKLMEAFELVKGENYFNEAIVYINLSDAYRGLNNSATALDYALKAKHIGLENHNNELISEAYESLYKTYEKISRFNDAFDCYEKYSSYKDSILNMKNVEVVSEITAKYQAEKKEMELEILTKDSEIQAHEIKRQTTIRNAVLILLLIVIVLLILFFSRYNITKQLNTELDKTNSLIYTKNQLIKENINYAKRIQQLILPPLDKLKTYFNDSFVFFTPKDVIGGDIFWFKSNKNKLLIAVADCTGHGVPGALMSMVAYNILNRSSKTTVLLDAPSLLSNVNKNLNKFVARKVDKINVRDGMDIAICEIDTDTLMLNYCGAQTPIYIVRNKQLTEYKAERVSMGDPTFFEHVFTSQTITLQKGDWIYMFTDGFADQKGGPLNKKYYYQPFKDMLVSLSDKSGVEQKNEIATLFNKWKGANEQLDDVLILGINI